MLIIHCSFVDRPLVLFLQGSVGEKAKADGARMDLLEARIAKKADAAALDAFRLQTALGAARAAVAGGGGSGRDTASPGE